MRSGAALLGLAKYIYIYIYIYIMFDNNRSKMGEIDWKQVQASTLLEFDVMTDTK